MKKTWIFLLVSTLCIPLYSGEHNATVEQNTSKEDNVTKKALKEAMELEEKYAKEQRFYQGDEYDLQSKEFSPETLKKVPSIEPDYDFNMDEGVYD